MMERKRLLLWAFVATSALFVADLSAAKGKESNEKLRKPTADTVAPMDQVLIKVDGIDITSRDYASFLQAHPEIISRAMTTEIGKADALKELVSAYLLRKAMIDEGLLTKDNPEPSPKDAIAAYEKLAERHFPLPKTPKDEEAYAYYQAHPANYGIPAMIRFSEILIKVAPKADDAVKAAARGRAEKALERVAAGQAFADVAAELTENPIGKITKGDIGFIDPDKESWMKLAVTPLKVGDRTKVIESPNGFAILAVTDIRPAVISPYANVRDKVIEDLKHEEQEKLRAPYVAGLAAKSKIEVVSPHIQPLFPNGLFPKP